VAIAAIIGLSGILVPEEPFQAQVSESEPNDDASKAQVLHSGQTVTGDVDDQTDPLDYFRVHVDAGVALCFNLTGPHGVDFDLHLYDSPDANAQEVANSIFPETSEEQICKLTQFSGWYHIAVRAFEGNGQYSLVVSIRPKIVSVDDNDYIDEAVSIQDGETVQGSVDKYWDVEDFFRIEVDAQQYLLATLYVPDKCDFDLYIYDPSGTGGDDWYNIGEILNEGVSASAYGNEFLNIAVEETGWWYANVYSYRGSGDYELTVEIMDSLTADDSDNGEIGLAEDITAELLADDQETVSGTMDWFFDDNDYYKATLDMGYTVTMRLNVPAQQDFDLYVYNWTGTGGGDYIMVANDTTSQEVLYLNITQTGTYYFNPYSYAGVGTYSLDLILSGGSGWPFANAGSDKPDEKINQQVNFDGSLSIDDMSIVSYEWDFGDYNAGAGQTVSHTYTQTGSYVVTLTVTDGDGYSSSDTLIVDVLAQSGKKYAVVVGISDYIYFDADSGDLMYADDDAIDWNEHLLSLGYEVTMLLDHDATLDNIRTAIEDMEASEEAGDYVVFTFSGHGGTWRERGYTDPGSHSMLFAADADTWGTGGLKDTELEELFQNFDSDHIFMFIDACRSGGMDEASGPGRVILQASADDEVALDAGRYSNGLWTYWFLGWALQRQGYESVEEAFNNAAPKAVDNAGQWDTDSHPEMEDGNPGEPFYL